MDVNYWWASHGVERVVVAFVTTLGNISVHPTNGGPYSRKRSTVATTGISFACTNFISTEPNCLNDDDFFHGKARTISVSICVHIRALSFCDGTIPGSNFMNNAGHRWCPPTRAVSFFNLDFTRPNRKR
ncbi:hypothetical protein BGY98DRAFT_1102802 [Russula aff. rugulosa BPL654]|nr:hypothetical protein BGY98DRAFT_1102802 [Russula aff. rugulosa BPL654]